MTPYDVCDTFLALSAQWCVQIITSRMRYISAQKEETGDPPVRILGLCTSLANAKDLGEWIGATSHGLFNFPPGQFTPQLAVYPQLACISCGQTPHVF